MWLPTIDIPNHFADIQFYSHVVFSIVLIVADAGFLEEPFWNSPDLQRKLFPWLTGMCWQNLKVLSVDH